MRMKRLSSILLSGLLTAWLTPIAAQALGHHQSGIIGQTVLGATCDPDGNCVPHAVPMGLLIHSDSGEFVADITSDSDGGFEIALKPDTYILTPYFAPPESIFIFLGAPVRVTVYKKQHIVTVVDYFPLSTVLR
jgi:hypothetical protein